MTILILSRVKGKVPQNVANLPNVSAMGFKICDGNSKKQVGFLLEICLFYYLALADRDLGASSND